MTSVCQRGRWGGVAVLLMAGCMGPRPRPAEPPPTVAPIPSAAAEAIAPAAARPYELQWAPRVEAYDPLVDFDFLLGWHVEPEPGLEAVFERSDRQPLWGRHAGKLTMEGGAPSALEIAPPEPIEIRDRIDSVYLWIHGPSGVHEEHRPRVVVVVDDAAGRRVDLMLGEVAWTGWNVLHLRLPADQLAILEAPLRLAAIRWENVRTEEPVTYYMDSLTAYTERRQTLRVAPCAPPEPVEVNTGEPGEMTELERGRFELRCRGEMGELVYEIDAGSLGDGIRVRWDGEDRGRVPYRLETVPQGVLGGEYRVARAEKGGVYIEYTNGVACSLSASGYRLNLAVEDRAGGSRGLRWIPAPAGDGWHPVPVPGLTASGNLPVEIGWVEGASSNQPPLFVCAQLDWNRSSASEFAGLEARYRAASDGTAHRLRETAMLTLSPRLETVYPPTATGSKPSGLLTDRIWADSDGPKAYAESQAETERLAALGIQTVIQGHLAACWRDGEESCTLRDRAAPGKGGDEALKGFLAWQQQQGWMPGLWLNYLHIHPLNAHWAEPVLQRTPDLNWRPGLPGHFLVKPVMAAALQAELATTISKRFAPAMAYVGDMAAVPPWAHTDFDAGAPDAGRFDAALQCIRQLLRTETEVRSGPVVSDSGAEAVYADSYDGYLVRENDYPRLLLPSYVLQALHPHAVRFGAGDMLLAMSPETRTAKMLDAELDRYLAHQIAFGAAGRLAPPGFGPVRECRSYYMMSLLQPLYLNQSPRRIAYWDGSAYISASQAIVHDAITDPRLYVRYGEETELWVNGSDHQTWEVRVGADMWTLPPFGWVVASPDFLELSGNVDGRRIDYVSAGLNRYLDGRGSLVRFRGLASSGPLLLRVLLQESGYRLTFTNLAGKGRFGFVPPRTMGDTELEVTAYDASGGVVDHRTAEFVDGMYWVEGDAFRYVVDVPTAP